ncbi:alpha/beta hydrolase [filamentous cyanobacterium CCP5]|nr:alpha/beta hydrolase [filamentous cyanobacterium CCP5]
MLTAPGFESATAVTPLGSVAYVNAGPNSEDNPAPESLVFLHGFGGGSSSYEWSLVYPAFIHRYRVLAPDLLGWGRSDHPERQYSIDDYLECLTSFLEQTCSAPAMVVASSLTAAFMVRVAIARPDLIRAMILVNPSGIEDFGKSYRNQIFAQIVRIPLVDKLLYWGAIANPDGIRSFLKERQFANPDLVTEEMVRAYLASASQANADYAALAFVQGNLCFDLAEYMPQLTVPSVIIWGGKAQFTEVEIGQRLAALNPEAIRQFELLPDVGLTPQLECPAITIGLIKKYLLMLG